MKKIYVLALATLFSSVSIAQLDLEAVLISPASGSTEQAGVISIEFDILNNGPDTIVEGDTIYFAALVDQALVDSDGTQNSANGLLIPNGSPDILPGESIPWAAISAAIGGEFEVDASNITSEIDICAVVLGEGSNALEQGGDPDDPDPTNNIDCFTAEPTSSVESESFDDVVNVELSGNNLEFTSENAEELDFTVVSISGQTVANGSFVNFSTVSTEGWKSGIYVVRVQGSQEVTSLKVAIQ
ncbi:MAG: T9SS type A sorting domain-containing protein [Brumimicrobium sp.]